MSKKILIVDDDSQIVAVLEKRLSKSGYLTSTALNGRDAIQKVAADKPDLIILDVMMPYMDGTEVARILREDPKTQHIPIIYLTALKTEQDEPVQNMFDNSPVFGKPFNSEDLMAKVEEILIVP